MNRALLQSGLLQQGFTQANQLAKQLLINKATLAATSSKIIWTEILYFRVSGRGSTAQEQAQLDATREANRLEALRTL